MVTRTIATPETEAKPGAPARPAAEVRRQAAKQLLGRAWFKKVLFLLGDVAAVTLGHGVAEAVVRRHLDIPQQFLNPSGYYLFYVPFFATVLYLFEGYKNPDLRRPEKELELGFKGVSVAFVSLACANFVFFKGLGFSRYLLVSWYVLTLVLLLGTRFSLRALYESFWRRGRAQQKALLVGSTHTLAEHCNVLSIQRYQGYQAVGVLHEPGAERSVSKELLDLPVLGSFDDWEQIAAEQQVQLIFLGLPATSNGAHPRALEVIRRCQEKGIDVEVYSDLFGSPEFNYERDDFSGSFRFYATAKSSRTAGRIVKYALDWPLGLAGSLATLLLLPVVGLLIWLEDGGPVFYRREFVGTDGEVRYYRKFRSMRQDADQILQSSPELKAQFDRKYKLAEDPRVLRVGRFLRRYSLDEFPQFFSLLTGQLTFVGPRVISREEKGRYGALLPKLLSVKPGLTGFWQVMGRQTTSYDERIQMDMFYIDHWSIWLDLVIMIKTVGKVLRAEGAY